MKCLSLKLNKLFTNTAKCFTGMTGKQIKLTLSI